jgi:hypothetical protein
VGKNRNGGRPRKPESRYKTLTVTPTRAALHFVRGHFKDYSVKGLFGKYKKVYWWDSQVRREVGGVVDKEYWVKRK